MSVSIISKNKFQKTGGGSTLLDGLVSYWKLTESSGDALDSKSYLNLTNSGATRQQTGKLGANHAYSFSGTSYLGNVADVYELSNISVAVWFYNSLSDTTSAGLVSNREASVGSGWEIMQNGEWGDSGEYGHITWVLGGASGANYHEQYGTFNTNDGAWHLAIGTFDGTDQKLYIDGNVDKNEGWAHSIGYDAGGQNFTIGCRGYWNDGSPHYVLPYTGLICEFGIWNRALLTTEMNSYWNGGSGITYPFS